MLPSIFCCWRGIGHDDKYRTPSLPPTTPSIPKMIHLHNIQIQALSHPHRDLPLDMQMFAQLIVDEHIVLQTAAMDSDASQTSWNFDVGWNVPEHALAFSVAILRHSKTQGTRILGSIKMNRGDALVCGERETPFCQEVAKVNIDGPVLEFSVEVSISDLLATVPGVVDGNNFPYNQISSLNYRKIRTRLFQIHEGETQNDPVDFWVWHQKILLLSSMAEDQAELLHILGNISFNKWDSSQKIDELNYAIWAYEDAARAEPTSTLYLNDLGVALFNRFELVGNPDDLNKCLLVEEDALSLIPAGDPEKPTGLSNLASSLFTRFERFGDLEDLNKSVLMEEEAVAMTPEGHPDRQIWLNNLANSLRIRFERFGDITDLTKLVSIHEDVMLLTPDGDPDKPLMFNNLGNALRIRFEQFGVLDDLNKSVSMHNNAVSLTSDGHPQKPLWLNNLANALRIRFERFGDFGDLNRAVLMHENAVSLTSDSHLLKPLWLNNLANALRIRFEHFGDFEDLNTSVLTHNKAMSLTSDGHHQKPLWLNNLANVLRIRFERFGDLEDLNKSVLMHSNAVSLTSDGQLLKPMWLSNLANSLRIRFERFGDLEDLNKSVLVYTDAISLTSDGHPDRPRWLHNLAKSLITRFEQLGDLADLNKSVLMYTDAISHTQDGHHQKPTWLNNFANCLRIRFEKFGDLGDLNKSVFMHQNVVSLTPDGHPTKPLMLSNLGNSLRVRFDQLGDPDDLAQIFLHYRSAAYSTTGAAQVRFEAASTWAHLSRIHGHSSLLDAYQVSLDLLPELAWLGLSVSDRHHHIIKAGVVVRDAAAAAIALGLFEKAVVWLEQGRSIIWGQFLSLRTPVDDLREEYPLLAEELVHLSAQLEVAGTRRTDLDADSSGTEQSLQSIAQQAHENAHKRAELLRRIRELKGFKRFLLPKTISELLLAAQRGSVVFVNLSSTTCDVLVLRNDLGDQVVHVPIPEFTPQHAETLIKSLENLIPYSGRGDRLFGNREGNFDSSEDQFAHILSELWVKLVKPVLDVLSIAKPVEDNWQRIWWCPTGSLASLPIHAAGLYGKDEGFGSKLADFVISSYTPSLATLMEGFRPRPELQKRPQLLAVAQSSSSGQSYLPGTQEEINHIQAHAGDKLPILRLEEHSATVDSVQQAMKYCSWAHFACHGVQRILNPTESALLLAGQERLTLSSIIKLSLPHADFAFLSACQTATGDRELQEEAVHLAAGMLLAGYRGVIATMWTIMDTDAPQVAGDVYEHLFKTSPLDPTRAAEALHLAVRKLREDPSGRKPFFRWVPFIHVGV